MTAPRSSMPQHVRMNRRLAVQAGAIGICGLGMNHVAGLSAMAARNERPAGKAKSVIYLFLSGGLGQHDSFDMKPDAPDNVRGEFNPIATKTPGLQICGATSGRWCGRLRIRIRCTRRVTRRC